MPHHSTSFYPENHDNRFLAAQPISGNPNITTTLYRTHFGVFSLAWSRSLSGRSFHLSLHQDDAAASSPLPSSLSFSFHIKPLFFWKKHGSKTLNNAPSVRVFWDLTGAKFGSGPDPKSGFYVAVVVDGEMALLAGDCTEEAYRKTKARRPDGNAQFLVFKRDHVYGGETYTTTAKFGGQTREISINCSINKDPRLIFNVDAKRVLQIKRLKWKFRGSERIEVDGVPIQVSWDVYNWLFQDLNSHKCAVFMFRFEDCDQDTEPGQAHKKNETGSCAGFGMTGIELRKQRKSVLMAGRSSTSSSSSSSASSGGSSSVMEWASSEENELSSSNPSGFSLLVYAWKR